MAGAVRTIMLLGVMAGAGCYQDSGAGPAADGITRVFLTDAGFPFASVSRVEVYVTEIAASTRSDTAAGASGWTVIETPLRRFDLLALQQGTTTLLGAAQIPAGDYRAVRLSIDCDSSRIVWQGGREASVRWPVSGELALHALVEQPLAVSEGGAQLVIDFDVGRSFTNQLADPLHDFVFMPVIRAVNASATGNLRGTVRGDVHGDGAPERLPGAGITVFRGDPTQPPETWSVVATGHTDSSGVYVVAYLLAGGYIVLAEAPAAALLGSLTVSHVSVAPGQDVTLPLVLPALGGASPMPDRTVRRVTPRSVEQSRSAR